MNDGGIGQRLKIIRQELGLSQRAMAEELSVSQGAWVAWELARSSPNAQALAALCARGFNGHWMLTGTGPMREAPGVSPSTYPPGSTAHTLQAEELEQLQRYGVTDIFLLARRGNQADLWQLMQVLNKEPTREFSLPDLVSALSEKQPAPDMRDVAADCRLLALRGVLQEQRRGGEIYYQILPVARLVAGDELGEVNWMRETIRSLVADILPKVAVPGSGAFGGQLLHGVPAGTARGILKRIREAMTTILREAGSGPERIRLFIAAGIDSEDI